MYHSERWKTCPACNGRCVIIVHDGPNKAHAERCPICNGTGRVRDYDPYQPWCPKPYVPWEPYEPWYKKMTYWDTNYYTTDYYTTAGNVHEFDSTIIS